MVRAAHKEDKSERQVLANLQAEQQHLNAQLRRVKKTKEEIDHQDLANQGRWDALKYAKNDLQQMKTRLALKDRGIDEKFEQSRCAWGTTSPDKAYVDSCNTLLDKLIGLKNDLGNEAITVEEYASKLQEEENHLSEATFRLGQKRKSNNADMEEVSAALSDWQHRYNSFVFQSETYERLKKTAPGARFCENLSMPMTTGALESASQCLQWLWDGAGR